MTDPVAMTVTLPWLVIVGNQLGWIALNMWLYRRIDRGKQAMALIVKVCDANCNLREFQLQEAIGERDIAYRDLKRANDLVKWLREGRAHDAHPPDAA